MYGILSVGLAGVVAISAMAQTALSRDDALLDALVLGAYVSIDPQAYSADLRAKVEEYLRRAAGYRSTRLVPSSSGLEKMVHAAQVGYELRLVAASGDPDAPRLATTYVNALRPCYEWEGFHDCPEHEALFADQYQTAHPKGPFSAYLPLLAAHRWLCTAEAYDYEKQPGHASRSRRLYQERLSVALKSDDPLIRSAAKSLSARGRCFARR